MLEDGAFISDVAYYSGCGSLNARAVRVNLDGEGICNICRLRHKKAEPLKLRERIKSGNEN